MSDRKTELLRLAPPRYKLALLTWAGAYAVITAILAVLGPAMAPWPLPLRTLLLSVLMVTALTWLVIPSLTRLFRDWLASSTPTHGSPRRKKARLAWLVPPLLLVAAVAGCGGGEGTANTSGDREERTTEERTTSAPSAEPSRDERLVSALRGGGYVIYFRHTVTDWAQDDELPVDLSDCATQRNLSDAGRTQASAIGEAFQRLDVPIGSVLSSPFCRTLDTARLASAGCPPSRRSRISRPSKATRTVSCGTTASGAFSRLHRVGERTASCGARLQHRGGRGRDHRGGGRVHLPPRKWRRVRARGHPHPDRLGRARRDVRRGRLASTSPSREGVEPWSTPSTPGSAAGAHVHSSGSCSGSCAWPSRSSSSATACSGSLGRNGGSPTTPSSASPRTLAAR